MKTLQSMTDAELDEHRLKLARANQHDSVRYTNATIEMLRRDRAKRLLPARA